MKYLLLYLAFIIGFILMGCSHTSELTGDNLHENEQDVDYSVIYYIHADSDYLYHNSKGEPITENSKVLSTAFKVAEEALSGEVFIYYQRRERKLLGLFPRRSSRIYHYRHGKLINRIKYRHQDKEEAFLTTEAQLLNEQRAQNRSDDHQNYFLYFGHEIPSENGNGYHQSLPGIDVNIDSFAKGIQNFLLSDVDRFDLIVLSTCNNGTPKMIEQLTPFTDVVLASPQNLHLSHFDSAGLSHLENEPGTSPTQLARLMAEETYQRLEATVQTTITLALYNIEYVKPYIHNLNSLTSEDQASDQSVQFQDNVDCAEIFTFEPETYQQGVETWYKPARFGRQSRLSTHSGWGCKPSVK